MLKKNYESFQPLDQKLIRRGTALDESFFSVYPKEKVDNFLKKLKKTVEDVKQKNV